MTGDLERLTAAIRALELSLPGELERVTDPVANANLLAVLRSHRNELVTLEQFVERALAERMSAAVLEWEGGRAIRRQTAEKMTWNHADLATAVAVAAMVDANGELPSEEAQIVGSNVKKLLFDFAGITYWRTKNLADIGIDVSDFRTRTRGRYVVEVEVA